MTLRSAKALRCTVTLSGGALRAASDLAGALRRGRAVRLAVTPVLRIPIPVAIPVVSAARPITPLAAIAIATAILTTGTAFAAAAMLTVPRPLFVAALRATARLATATATAPAIAVTIPMAFRAARGTVPTAVAAFATRGASFTARVAAAVPTRTIAAGATPVPIATMAVAATITTIAPGLAAARRGSR